MSRHLEKPTLALLDYVTNSSGRTVDTLYATFIHKLGLTQPFFKAGWGDLRLVDFERDAELLRHWPPKDFDIQIQWKKVSEGTREGVAFELIEGSFKSPCQGRIFDALPKESRMAHVQLLMPKIRRDDHACVVHLAGTGDHGFSRRIRMGAPLLKQGIATLVLESPYYGMRRPPEQEGSRLLRVSDLLLLGRSTIEESLCLLEWAGNQGGFSKLGMCGFSMGGVHASMVSSLYPKRIATTPLLAPRSASVSFCYGALRDATAWKPLTSLQDEKQQDVIATIKSAAKPTSVTDAAKHVKIHSDLHQSKDKESSWGRESYESSPSGPEERAESAELLADEWRSASRKGTAMPRQNNSQALDTTDASSPENSAGYSLAQRLPWWVQSGGGAVINVLNSVHRRLPQPWGEKHTVEFDLARRRLEQVLETYTDVTRFPCPKAPEAAVLVGAMEDAYVSRESIREVSAHWPGSEVRWVPGGHVSAFLLQQTAFRKAIVDSLDRLGE